MGDKKGGFSFSPQSRPLRNACCAQNCCLDGGFGFCCEPSPCMLALSFFLLSFLPTFLLSFLPCFLFVFLFLFFLFLFLPFPFLSFRRRSFPPPPSLTFERSGCCASCCSTQVFFFTASSPMLECEVLSRHFLSLTGEGRHVLLQTHTAVLPFLHRHRFFFVCTRVRLEAVFFLHTGFPRNSLAPLASGPWMNPRCCSFSPLLGII